MDYSKVINFVLWYQTHIIYSLIILLLSLIIIYIVYNDSFGVIKLRREFFKIMKPFRKKVRKQKVITLKDTEEIFKILNELKEKSQRINISIFNGYNISQKKRVYLLARLYALDKLIDEFYDYVKVYHNQLVEYETINERPPLDADVIKKKNYEKRIKVKSKIYDNDHKGLYKEGFEKDRHIYNESEVKVEVKEEDKK